jgi:hypothetical protein
VPLLLLVAMSALQFPVGLAATRERTLHRSS